MKDKKLAIFSVIIIAASVLVLLIAIFGQSAKDTPAVLLPSAGSSGGDDSAFASVTPATVQEVIKTLSRPDSYSRTLTTEDFWAQGGSSSSQLQVWVSGERTRIQWSKSASTENILLTGDGTWIWYDNSSGVFHSSQSSDNADEWMRAVSYEELLDMPQSAITNAGYSKYAGEGCLWAEYYSPSLGYRNVEYISVSSGLLMGVESYDGDKLIYRMTSGAVTVAPQDANLFEAPAN